MHTKAFEWKKTGRQGHKTLRDRKREEEQQPRARNMIQTSIQRRMARLLEASYRKISYDTTCVTRPNTNMNMRFVAFLSLAFLCSLHVSAQEKSSFWSHGLGKFLKSADEMVDRWQEAGVDTNYIRKPKLSRMVYLGYYGYFQQHDMTFPVSVDNVDIPLNRQYMPSNMSEKKYMMADMHTYQSEM